MLEMQNVAFQQTDTIWLHIRVASLEFPGTAVLICGSCSQQPKEDVRPDTETTRAAARAAARRPRAERLDQGMGVSSHPALAEASRNIGAATSSGRLQRSGGCCSRHNAALIPNPITVAENQLGECVVRTMPHMQVCACVCVSFSLQSINATTHCRTPLLILALTQYAACNDDSPSRPLLLFCLPPHGQQDGGHSQPTISCTNG